MREKIMEILNELHPDADLSGGVLLVDDGVLDSMDIVTLVTELNAAFGVRIGASDILPDHFNSVDALCALIKRLDDI